jgi:2-polyprenyl-3-methyl-5-hydroxy-6-metoxy-1,4-benzoquinol methylase
MLKQQHPRDRALAQINQMIERQLGTRDKLRVLEAGCGSISYLTFPPDTHLVGIDISEAQLRKNTYLDEKILGDIESHEFPTGDFDAIVCWNVFEHLPHPERSLSAFSRAISPGGLIILALPNALSVKGLITKFTPFKFHVWVTRHLVGRTLAGTEGNPPYPTFMRFSIAPAKLVKRAREHGLSLVYSSLFEDNKQQTIRRRLRIDGARWRFLQRAVRLMTLGTIETARAQCIFVFQKPPADRSLEASR